LKILRAFNFLLVGVRGGGIWTRVCVCVRVFR